MTTKTDTDTSSEELIARVLEFDAKVVGGHWRRTAGLREFTVQTELPCINGLRAWFTVAPISPPDLVEQEYTEGVLNHEEALARADLIAYYRTAAPLLARRLSSTMQALKDADAALLDIHGLMEKEFGPGEWAPDHPTAIAIEAARARAKGEG